MVSHPSTLLDIFMSVGRSGGVAVEDIAQGVAVTYHWRCYQAGDSIQQRLLDDYFGEPLKPAGDNVVPYENVPEPYLSLLNQPTGSLLLSIVMKRGNISLQGLSEVLDVQFGSCTNPPLNLATNQTLYGRERKKRGERRVEMALLCPHHGSDIATLELTDYYLSPDSATMLRLRRQLKILYSILQGRSNLN